MKAKMLLGLGAVAAVLMLGPGVNGLTTERGKSLRYLEDQRPVEVTAQLPGLLNEEAKTPTLALQATTVTEAIRTTRS
ncbi:hypothetical protein JG687_00004092 [Phytophthora cactorum]|uniref:RxLR effector protein n=1 Tax=Phytophthora cactorum TaxID=29920 RepID=A0A329T4L0_9STRA|nr:hypothetical protein Pcac1_g2538 [Phytophthora cactorum]KAG2813360.1 hypothetical protein PC112_g14771 [Phytophthora cactorum]KAG2826368.1 hypothetical protein PC111_g8993 [Phytophthora cactorum]KAG2852549.1 hypothetical protein PC113_g14926 [Phytophthora cactorum]KAG2893586.1 hypothetical protein PC114_g16180 [Phytophthora cactorum]